MKKFDSQLLKFSITKKKLKMEIGLKDLVWLFNRNPNNFDGNKPFAKIRRGKRQEFAEYVVGMLMDDSLYEKDCIRWAEPFENIFNEILEGAEDSFCKYPDNEN